MAKEEEEKIRIKLEVPKKEVQIESISSEPGSEESKKTAEETVDKQEEDKKKTEEKESTIAGYKPSEIAKAPVDTPEPEDKRGPNSRQKTLIIFGLALAAASVILWPLFSFWIFVPVAIAGAAVVAFGSLVRV